MLTNARLPVDFQELATTSVLSNAEGINSDVADKIKNQKLFYRYATHDFDGRV